ncbi:MAG: ABC transporter permease [bacterium]
MNRRDWPGLRRVFRLPLGKRRVRADVDAELDFHIQGRIEQLMAGGMSRDHAEAETRRLFGDYTRIEAEMEHIDSAMNRRRSFIERAEALAADIKYAARALWLQPVFSSIVILTLTIGIGATTAIFHVVDRAVLRPLPYPEPENIVYLGWSFGTGKGSGTGAISPRKFVFWHAQSRVFDGLAATRAFGGTLGSGPTATSVQGLRVTDDFFRVVGIHPSRGRAFNTEDFAAGAPAVVILGHSVWMTRFGGDSAIIGRVIRIDDTPYTVIGLMSASFELAEQTDWSQFLAPLRFTDEDLADGGNNYMTMGRLRRGNTPAQVAQDMALVFDRFRAVYPEINKQPDRGMVARRYNELFLGGLEPVLWILLGATLFVLLLACANVATLLLSRMLSRQREFAVRTALGAERGRIVRQVLMEALVLGLVSAVLASAASVVSVRALTSLVPGGILREGQLGIDLRVVLYTTLIGVVASLGIGLGVALPATRIDLARSLGEATRSGSGSRRQRAFRNALVATESAVAMLLLSAAGLLIASFASILRVDPGFARDGIVTARVARAPAGYDSAAAVNEFQRRVLERLRGTPGVASAASASSLPLQRGWNLTMTLVGNDDATEGGLEWRAASGGYFQTFGIPILQGRGLSDADIQGGQPVVVVSESFAKAYWPNENPLGRRIWVGKYKGKAMGPGFVEPAREIVGVVPDMKDMSLDQLRVRHTVWIPIAQTPRALVRLPVFVVRTTDANAAATALRGAIAEVDPRMPRADVTSMNDVASGSLVMRRFSVVLMSIFAALALGLTSVGIYGVVRYSVERRVHEIGVRMALGARPGTVVRLMVGQGIRPVMIGLLVGLGAFLALSRVLGQMLFRVSPHDPLTLVAVSAVLAGVATLASYLPARRATRIDPLAALRSD